MGQSRNRLRRLKGEHPFCCFCGGSEPTETIEHAPPKVFFQEKIRLKGLEFPACYRCNNGSSQLDQVASFVALAMAGVLKYDEDNPYWLKIAKGVRNNTPEVLNYLGLEGEHLMYNVGGVSREVVRSKFDPRLVKDFLNPWAAKQVYALWYEHSGQILPQDSRVFVKWLTNDELARKGFPDSVLDDQDREGTLKQGKLEASEQFFYKYAVNAKEGLGKFVIGSHNSSAVIGIVFPKKAQADIFTIPFKEGELFETSAETGIAHANLPR